MNDLRDKLASYAHEIWLQGMKYFLSKSYKMNSTGEIGVSGSQVERWKRLMSTSFDNLTEDEKLFDYEIADRILNILNGRE